MVCWFCVSVIQYGNNSVRCRMEGRRWRLNSIFIMWHGVCLAYAL